MVFVVCRRVRSCVSITVSCIVNSCIAITRISSTIISHRVRRIINIIMFGSRLLSSRYSIHVSVRRFLIPVISIIRHSVIRVRRVRNVHRRITTISIVIKSIRRMRCVYSIRTVGVILIIIRIVSIILSHICIFH